MNAATKEKCRALPVDDDRLVLATLSAGPRQANYAVIEACNGDVALDAIADVEPDIATDLLAATETIDRVIARHQSRTRH